MANVEDDNKVCSYRKTGSATSIETRPNTVYPSFTGTLVSKTVVLRSYAVGGEVRRK